MSPPLVLWFVAFTLGLHVGVTQRINLLMPHVKPNEKESYLCTAHRMRHDDFEYIVGFEPNATMHTAHHILIYGCAVPGFVERDTSRAVWDCGEMAKGHSGYPRAPTCAKGSQVIYAWAKDAPALTLPEGVGFKIGRGSGINFLVLQVHYADVSHFKNGGTDDSGIFLTTLPSTTTQVTKSAGVLLLGTGGMIPAQSSVHMETACQINEALTIHPFAFRTHTHTLGKVVSGYVIKPDNQWERIGKHDPQKPQMFYPVNKEIRIEMEDVVAARCTMNNTRYHDVFIGPTAEHEMCNFYIMYYVNGDLNLEHKYCFTAGPPQYRWDWDPLIDKVPKWVDTDASDLKE